MRILERKTPLLSLKSSRESTSHEPGVCRCQEEKRNRVIRNPLILVTQPRKSEISLEDPALTPLIVSSLQKGHELMIS